MFSIFSLLSEALSFVGLITEVIVFVGCVMYLSRTKTSDSRLLFIGSLIGLIVRVFYFLIPFLTSYGSGYDSMSTIIGIGSFLSFVGGLLFCIGFIRLIQSLAKKESSSSGFGALDS
jgi:hypothetical protein